MRIVILKMLIIGISLSGFSYFFNENLYRSLVKEDGVFEYMTALTMLLIFILLTYRIIQSKKPMKWFAYNILLALAAFFVFGEEISWGQRIFSIESNEFFKNYNLQNETNIHNLEINGIKLNKLIFSLGITIVVSFYFVCSLLLYKKNAFFKRQTDEFGIHIPRPEQTMLMLITTLIILIIPDGRKWELWETTSVLTCLLVLLNPFNEKENITLIKNE